MLRIINPLLKRLLLEQIVEQIDGGGLDELLQAGFSAEFLDMLRHRPARDLIKLSESETLNFQVAIHEPSVAGFLQRLDAMRRDAFMREYFVRHGAPVRVVSEFFRMSAEDVRCPCAVHIHVAAAQNKWFRMRANPFSLPLQETP